MWMTIWWRKGWLEVCGLPPGIPKVCSPHLLFPILNQQPHQPGGAKFLFVEAFGAALVYFSSSLQETFCDPL